METTSARNENVVKVALDEVLKGAYNYKDSMGTATAATPELFKITSHDSGSYTYEEFAGPGKWDKKDQSQAANESGILTGNKTTVAMEEWAQDFPVPRTFFADAKHDVITQGIAEMGREGRHDRDQNAISIYVDGFDDKTTPDSAYVWSNSHTNLNGDTIDNLETGTLNPDNLKSTVNSLYKQKNQRGRLGGHHPAALLCAADIFDNAVETLGSANEAYTTDNQVNYFAKAYPDMKMFRSPWISSAFSGYTNADTCYFVVSQNHHIARKVREPLSTTLVSWEFDADKQDNYRYKGRFREECFAGDWQGAIGSTGV